LLAVLEVQPAILFCVLELLAQEIFDFDVAVDEFAVVSEEQRLGFAQPFASILEDVLLDLAQLDEQLFVLVEEEPAWGRRYLQLGSSGSWVLRVKITVGTMSGLLLRKN
jgi:hypothetical protein